MGGIDGAIKTIARYYKWKPAEINELFCDDIDHLGLLYWYNDAKEQDDKSKSELARIKNRR